MQDGVAYPHSALKSASATENKTLGGYKRQYQDQKYILFFKKRQDRIIQDSRMRDNFTSNLERRGKEEDSSFCTS